jgi:hypothetical protein
LLSFRKKGLQLRRVTTLGNGLQGSLTPTRVPCQSRDSMAKANSPRELMPSFP